MIKHINNGINSNSKHNLPIFSNNLSTSPIIIQSNSDLSSRRLNNIVTTKAKKSENPSSNVISKNNEYGYIFELSEDILHSLVDRTNPRLSIVCDEPTAWYSISNLYSSTVSFFKNIINATFALSLTTTTTQSGNVNNESKLIC